ncbi:MAG: ABC transporter permease [Acidobacteria bacterium]|nr:ABC transporter permease [Acidobacteriota bacterium]
MRLAGQLVLELALALVGIYTLVFLAFAVLPVDPARAVLGPTASAQAVAKLRHDFGLEEPLPARYWRTLSRMAAGDFGQSFYFQRPAGQIVSELAPRTLGRAALALVLGFALGLLAGRVAGGRRVGWLRNVLVALQSIPSFCVMLILLWAASRLFAMTPLHSPFLYEVLAVCGAAAYPTGSIGLFVSERIAPTGSRPRHVEFLEMLHAPRSYIVWVLWQEAVPGAIAILINSFGIVLTAVSFAELIFGIDGFGIVFFRSCERGDLSLVTAGTLLLSLIVIVIQKIGDTALRVLDPRVAGE